MKHHFTTDEPLGRFELHFSSKFFLDGVFAPDGVSEAICCSPIIGRVTIENFTIVTGLGYANPITIPTFV